MDRNIANKQSQNFHNNQISSSYLFSTDDSLNTLRSSRMKGQKCFGLNSNANFNFQEVTMLKNASDVSRFLPQTKFIEDITGVNTQRKIIGVIETIPKQSSDSVEVQSKQTVVGGNANFSLNFNLFGQNKLAFNQENKENTILFSNEEINPNNKKKISSGDEREIISHTLDKGNFRGEKSDSFKIPNKKTNFTQVAEGNNLFNSVKVNLQQSFLQSKDFAGGNIFDQKGSKFSEFTQINKFNNLTTTLISSGSSSSSQISTSSQGVSNGMQISQKYESNPSYNPSENESMIISRDSRSDKESYSKKIIIAKDLNNPFNAYQKNVAEEKYTSTNFCNKPFTSKPYKENQENYKISSPQKEYKDLNANSDEWSQQTAQTVTESLLEGFDKKANFFIPPDRTNDEKFKLLALKKIRKFNFKDNKSVSHAEIKNAIEGKPSYNYIQNSNQDYPMDDESQSITDSNIFGMKRKKMAHSVKRFYASDISFTDPATSKTKEFKIYKDSDIGIGEHWQQFLHNSNADEDVPSDDELVNRARKHCLDNLWEACLTVFKNKEFDKIHNLYLLKNEKEVDKSESKGEIGKKN